MYSFVKRLPALLIFIVIYIWFFSSCQKEGNYRTDTTQSVDSTDTTPVTGNKVPIANAGLDQTITLPVNSVTLKGSGTDSDGTIASYQWSKISGPASFTIVAPTQAQTDVNSLEKGTYQFKLQVTDNKGATASDTVQVIVLDGTVTPPSINETWSKLYGGSGLENATSIAATQDGGYIVAGYSNSNDGDVSGNHGADDVWIFKLDANGNKQWSKLYGGFGFDDANSIIVARDGGYIVAGHTSSNEGDVSGRKGGVDAWIFKIDATGKMLWSKTFGGSANDVSYSIVAAPNSGYVIAGYTESNDGDATGNHGKGDFWLLKIDENGNKVWSNVYGGSMSEQAYSVALTPDNGYILTGISESNDGDVSGNHGLQEGMVIKVDAGGNKQWSKLLGGTSEDILYSVKSTPDGNYIMAGRTTSSNGDITGFHGAMDVWVVKLDGSGNKLWSKVYGGSHTDEAHAIATTADGGFAIAGDVFSNDGDVSGNHGLDDGWVLKLDPDGNKQWSKTFGGSNEDFTSSILVTSDGKYIMTGNSSSNDGDVTGNHGIIDAWVIKIKP